MTVSAKPLEPSSLIVSETPADGKVAVIDVGSNSVRLVVYDGLHRAPYPVFNEKVLCGLGRSLDQTGKLDAEAVDHAVRTVRRFVELLRAMQVADIEVVATAAVRDAANGDDFVSKIEQQTGAVIRVLSGTEEARFSSLGVLSACPDAEGIMGDLGGGSLELVALRDGATAQASTLPIGPLRLRNIATKPRRLIDDALAGLNWLPAVAGGDLHVVGGAWRALGRIHMARTGYPLKVLHGLALPAADMETLARLISGLGRTSLKRISGVPKERLDTLPLAALILSRLLRVAQPARVVFSAYGLREGLLFDKLAETRRAEDPLLDLCRRAAQRRARFPEHADELMRWIDPLFVGETSEQRRLRHAAAVLSDIAWRAHPEYRAESALTDILHGPFVGVDHAGRAWLALSVHARYTGSNGGNYTRPARIIIDQDGAAVARQVGLALRLGHTLSGGVPGLLDRSRLQLTGENLILDATGSAELIGDVVERRLETLARAFDRDYVIKTD